MKKTNFDFGRLVRLLNDSLNMVLMWLFFVFMAIGACYLEKTNIIEKRIGPSAYDRQIVYYQLKNESDNIIKTKNFNTDYKRNLKIIFTEESTIDVDMKIYSDYNSYVLIDIKNLNTQNEVIKVDNKHNPFISENRYQFMYVLYYVAVCMLFSIIGCGFYAFFVSLINNSYYKKITN